MRFFLSLSCSTQLSSMSSYNVKMCMTTWNLEQLNLGKLNWGSSLSINKLCHIIYGNMRNDGYKYFGWNCDRGFLSRNKHEDVKIFAARHKPNVRSIAEMDLKRNELNCNDQSTNEFSSEQIHEVFKIDGYRISQLEYLWKGQNNCLCK